MGEVEGQVRSEEHLDAEREARRRTALAQIRQYPDPVLRMRANEVEDFDDSVASLVERMTALMQEARGVGLAAPQVGVLRRVLVYQTSDETPVVALVNRRSSPTRGAGGCRGRLPLPRRRDGRRSRRGATSLTVEGTSPDGEPLTVEPRGSKRA